MTWIQRLARVPASWWVAGLALLLVLPGLGGFGFWDPWELGLADRARDLARAGSLTDVTLGGRYGAEPPLRMLLVALGVKLLGASELGARLPGALVALLVLVAVYHAGVVLGSRRSALLSVLVLATTPIFYLQARQLPSDLGLTLGLSLALAGFGRLLVAPAPGVARGTAPALVLALAGLGLGLLAGGVLLGVALPLLCVGGTLLVTGTAWRSGRGLLLMGASALGVLLTAAAFLFGNVATRYSPWLGATPHGQASKHLFVYFVRQLGFGTFPWAAVALFGLGRAFVTVDEEESGADATADVYLLVWAALSFALFTIVVLMTGEARFAALAPVALAAGRLLDRAMEREAPALPVLGLLIAIGTVLIARDIHLAPEELFSAHLLRELKWPPVVRVGPTFLATGLLAGAGAYAALALRPGPGAPDGRAPAPAASGPLARLLARGRAWTGRAARLGPAVLLLAAVFSALYSTHLVVPRLSQHFSFKPVFQSFARFARPGDVFGRYRVEGHGAHFYTDQAMEELTSQDQLIAFFRQDRRAFCLVPNGDLAALDAGFKTAGVPYHVVDASSSRFTLLSNRLDPGQEDENPLRRDVWLAPAAPTQHLDPAGGSSSWSWPDAPPPWRPAQPVHAVFGDSIELLGADFPTEISRPASLPVTLYFRVRRAPPPGHKIFLHFDIPGHPRFNGDHDPLGGTFPTSYWLPGEYIRDRHQVDVPYMTTPAGVYTVFVGFWPGGDGKRLPITEGANDGADRARLGSLHVR